MEMLEKVELIREKCNVSYEEARNALTACNGDVLDAIVMLENEHKVTERMPTVEQREPEAAPEVTYELPEAAAGTGYTANAQAQASPSANSAWRRFCAKCKELWNAGMEMTFVAERKGERVLALPVALVVLGMLLWGATLWLMVLGLFFGLRYRIEGDGRAAQTVNDAMDKAADAADNIKESIA